MKNNMIKMITLLLFTAVAISSCSLEYRQRRMHKNDPNWHAPQGHDRDHDHDRHDDNSHRN